MDEYVSKPVSPKSLYEVLERWFGTRDGEISHMRANVDTSYAVETDVVVWDRIGLFNRLMGDHELATKVTAGFLDDIPRQIQVLRELLETSDVAGCGRRPTPSRGRPLV